MAFKMKNTAYYKKKFTESEMASPYNKSSFTANGELMDKAKDKYEQHVREGKVTEVVVDKPAGYDENAYREND